MPARYDKYDPLSGGFRAALATDWADADVDKPFGVGLNAAGRVVKGQGQTGVRAVLVVDAKGKKAGDIVDCMTAGEIVDCEDLAAGTVYYADASDGEISDTAPAAGETGVRVGHTVEATRLVVRVAPVTVPAEEV